MALVPGYPCFPGSVPDIYGRRVHESYYPSSSLALFRRGSVVYVRHTICPRHPVCVAFSLGSRQAVVCSPPHGSSTPTVVLTEPPPLFETVAGREYHCHSDCHGHAGCSPALAEGPIALPEWGSWRTLLRRLTLSRIVGTDVLDEWVFGFQRARGCRVALTPPIAEFFSKTQP